MELTKDENMLTWQKFTLYSFCILAIFSIAVVSVSFFTTATELSRQDTCYKTLTCLTKYFELYSLDFEVYPEQLDDLQKVGLDTKSDSNIYHCLSCSVIKGGRYAINSIFDLSARQVYYEKKPQIDFCYLYHKSLPITDSTILIYCPHFDEHQGKVQVLFCGGRVERVPWQSFKKLFDNQAALLKKANVDFTFKNGIK